MTSLTKHLRTACPDLDPDWPDILGNPRGPRLCVSYPNCHCGEQDQRATEQDAINEHIANTTGARP